MTPHEQARRVLQLWLSEVDAAEGARISHGAISAKFATRADECRAERERVWQEGADQQQVLEELLDLVTRLLGKLTLLDPAHRSATSWLSDVGAPTTGGA